MHAAAVAQRAQRLALRANQGGGGTRGGCVGQPHLIRLNSSLPP